MKREFSRNEKKWSFSAQPEKTTFSSNNLKYDCFIDYSGKQLCCYFFLARFSIIIRE